MRNNRRNSHQVTPQSTGLLSPRIQTMEKSQILKEIDRLRNLDCHHKRIQEIIHCDPMKRGSSRLSTRDRQVKRPPQNNHQRYCKYFIAVLILLDENMMLKSQNVKILKRIVDAR